MYSTFIASVVSIIIMAAKSGNQYEKSNKKLRWLQLIFPGFKRSEKQREETQGKKLIYFLSIGGNQYEHKHSETAFSR